MHYRAKCVSVLIDKAYVEGPFSSRFRIMVIVMMHESKSISK